EGPTCGSSNALTWWRIEYQGIEGWTAEGDLRDYWLEPLDANVGESIQACPDTPSSFLAIGSRGRTILTVRLRETPGTSGERLRAVEEGEQFTVVGGHTCSDGYTWWQIQTSTGDIGWA